ncbi:hypothetical protein P4536_24075 [Bacillus thuringiensis]|nr:hypothetical protein [Bacillus thuringiensis]
MYHITYNECMADCMSGPYGGTYQECNVPCSKYHGTTHPTFGLKQPIPVAPSSHSYEQCMTDCMSGPYGGTYQECKVPCSKYHGATHPTFSLKQPIPVVPSSYSYEQCMWEFQSQEGYSYECKPICQQYKNPRPLYSYPVSPYSYFPMQSIF